METTIMLYLYLTRSIFFSSLSCNSETQCLHVLLLEGINYVCHNGSLSGIRVLLHVQILQEDPDYSEALIGRGTAYAFQRELHTAIADFTKVCFYKYSIRVKLSL